MPEEVLPAFQSPVHSFPLSVLPVQSHKPDSPGWPVLSHEAAAYLPDKEEIHMITADEALVNEKKEQWQNRFVDIFREVSGK